MIKLFVEDQALPIANETKRFFANGQYILIANIENQLYAVDDMCTHEDASLSLGALKELTISCSLHGSRFCLKSGVALDEPAELALNVYKIAKTNRGINVTSYEKPDR